jgi:hypothetical protein
MFDNSDPRVDRGRNKSQLGPFIGEKKQKNLKFEKNVAILKTS